MPVPVTVGPVIDGLRVIRGGLAPGLEGRHFIDRPIFAAVIAIVITLVGAISYFGLPIAQYPDVVRRRSQVSASIRAPPPRPSPTRSPRRSSSRSTASRTCSTCRRQSTNDGRADDHVTFKLGTDLDMAQVLVQNRVAIAEPSCPRRSAASASRAKKKSPDLLMVVNLISPDGSRDQLYISNYATLNVRDELTRVGRRRRPDVRRPRLHDAGLARPEKAAPRHDGRRRRHRAPRAERPGRRRPDRPAARRQWPGVPAQRREHARAARRPPRSSPTSSSRRRPTAPGHGVRDVGRVELGAETTASTPTSTGGRPWRSPSSSCPAPTRSRPADVIKRRWRSSKSGFPAGIDYAIVYDTTEFISESIDEVIKTLFEAIILVVIVVILFPAELARGDHPGDRHSGLADRHVRRDGRVRLLAQQPVAVRAGAGHRHRRRRCDRRRRERRAEPEQGLTPREAARGRWTRSAGPDRHRPRAVRRCSCRRASSTGIGQFYRQFAVTIASATVDLLLLSLTLSPALAALLLKPKGEASPPAE